MKRPDYVNPNVTGKDVSAIALVALIALSVLLAVGLVSPGLPTLGGGSPLRLLLPVLAACAGIPLIAVVFVRDEPEEEEPELGEEEAWLRELVYGEE